MRYVSVAEARDMPGLRLALTAQSPGPFGIAARAIFDLHGVPYVPVRQDAMAPNPELVAWTGRRNAPVAVLDDEPPVDGWLEIVNLGERLGHGPSLWPDDPEQRVIAAGLSSEIMGHGGFGWSRRISMSVPVRDPSQPLPPDAPAIREYRMTAEHLAQAQARVVEVLGVLAARLHAQKASGSPYFVGDRLSACDLHWAAFSEAIAPLPVDQVAVAPPLHAMFSHLSDIEREALDPILIEHRDRIWRDHIGLPFDYLPEED